MEREIRRPLNTSEWESYYQLRYDVLRKPLDQLPGSEKNEGDLTGQHFAIFQGDEILAIARLDEVDSETAQTRFVAVNPEFQKQGLGAMIMLAVEEKAKLDGKSKMVLHARDYALPFYEKIGYKLIEKSYKLFDVLQHYLMEKKL